MEQAPHSTAAGPIADGIYTLKYNMTYVTGGKVGDHVVLDHIGIAPPKDDQKFEVKFDSHKNAYCFLQYQHHPHVHDHGEEAEMPRYGLSYHERKDRSPIIIGHPHLFRVVIEIFGGDEHFGLTTLGGGSSEKFNVGLAPEKIAPARLDLLHNGPAIYFELLKEH